MTKFSARTWSRYRGFHEVSTLPRRAVARAPLSRPPSETADAHEVAAAWAAFAARDNPRVKIRTPRGAEWAHVIRHEASWVARADMCRPSPVG